MAPMSKRRKDGQIIQEINFDPAARYEYLTGFHKRKLQRTKQAREVAAKKDREEKREQRRKMREERAMELQRILKDTEQRIRNTIGDSDSDGDDWEGPIFDGRQKSEEPPPVDYEAEYIDEDKYTTVIVEDMGLPRGELQTEDAKGYDNCGERGNGQNANPNAKKLIDSKRTRQNQNQPKRKKKFRYESKAERRIAERRERTGNRKKANARRDR